MPDTGSNPGSDTNRLDQMGADHIEHDGGDRSKDPTTVSDVL